MSYYKDVISLITKTATESQKKMHYFTTDNEKLEINDSNYHVIREGKKVELYDRSSLVPGDIIIRMKAGTIIPADIRIIECSDTLTTNHSSLTGLDINLKRSTEYRQLNIFNAENMLFQDTIITQGECIRGVVILTGSTTFKGRILDRLNQSSEFAKSEYISFQSIINYILAVSFVFVFAWLVTEYCMDRHSIMILASTTGIIVAFLPENIVIVMSTIIIVTMKRIRNKLNIQLKSSKTLEDLGRVTTICSPITGVLTESIPKVTEIMFDFDVISVAYRPSKIDRILRCCCLCNDARWDDVLKYLYFKKFKKSQPFKIDNKLEWEPIGNPIDCSLLQYCEENEINIDSYLTANPRIIEIPFNKNTKFQVSVNHISTSPNHLITMKGAPEVVIPRCKYYYDKSGLLEELGISKLEELKEKFDELSSQGKIVLAVAELELDYRIYNDDYKYSIQPLNFPIGEDWKDTTHELNNKLYTQHAKIPLTFIGFVILNAEPIAEIDIATKQCLEGGIKYILTTGESVEAAKAIARRTNLVWSMDEPELVQYNKKNGLVSTIPGYKEPAYAELLVLEPKDITKDIPDEVWEDILEHPQIILARVTPEMKYYLMDQLIRREEKVLLVGNDVTDLPSLDICTLSLTRQSNIAQIVQDKCNIICEDDYSLPTITKLLKEGRSYLYNTQKSIAYSITSNVSQFACFACYIMMGIPFPLSISLVIVNDCIIELINACTFSTEEPENDIFERNALKKHRSIMNRKLICFSLFRVGIFQLLGCWFSFLVVMTRYGYPVIELYHLGEYNNWGKQTLFCQVRDGHFYNIDGKEKSPRWELSGLKLVDDIHKIYQEGYWFYKHNDFKDIYDCVYPVKNYKSNSYDEDEYDKHNPYTYKKYTDNEVVVTDLSINALYRNGYVEFIPYRASQSSFWNQEWLKYDIYSKDEVGLAGRNKREVFPYQPIGIYKVTSPEQTSDEAYYIEAAENDIRYDDDISQSVNQWMMFKYAILEVNNGQKYPNYSFPHLTTIENNHTYINIASRMCQQESLAVAQTAVFISIIILQICNCLICKSKIESLYNVGFKNVNMFNALVFSLIFTMFFTYTPKINNLLIGSRATTLEDWFTPLLFVVIFIVGEEILRLLTRIGSKNFKDGNFLVRNCGWLERNTYY